MVWDTLGPIAAVDLVHTFLAIVVHNEDGGAYEGDSGDPEAEVVGYRVKFSHGSMEGEKFFV